MRGVVYGNREGCPNRAAFFALSAKPVCLRENRKRERAPGADEPEPYGAEMKARISEDKAIVRSGKPEAVLPNLRWRQ